MCFLTFLFLKGPVAHVLVTGTVSEGFGKKIVEIYPVSTVHVCIIVFGKSDFPNFFHFFIFSVLVSYVEGTEKETSALTGRRRTDYMNIRYDAKQAI